MTAIYVVIGVGALFGVLALSSDLMIKYGDKWEKHYLHLAKKCDNDSSNHK